MRKATWRERVRYAFDNYMAKGTPALVGGLFAASVLLIVGASFFIWLTGSLIAGGTNPVGDFLGQIWSALLHTLDSSYIENDQGGSLPLIGAMLVLTFGGIFVVALLIGILSNGIQNRLVELRKGTSRVIEDQHVIILGWSQQVFQVIGELVVANSNRSHACIVVLADTDKVEMEDAIHARIPHMGRTRVVCRSGSPIDLSELEIANVQSSRAIIVLSPPGDDPDADVIKTLLAITNDPKRREAPYHVVAELRDPRNIQVARMIGKDEVELVLVGDLIARITAQTCRQPGLSVVYTELLDFAGDEIYVMKVPELVGSTFGDALMRFEDSALIGLLPSGGVPELNPAMETVIGPDDQLVIIAEDDDTVKAGAPTPPPIQSEAIVEAQPRVPRPERTLVLGWNWRTPEILTELDNYVAPGSEAVVVADQAVASDDLEVLQARMKNQRFTFHLGDTTDRRVLDGLNVNTFDHVIIVSYSDTLDVQRADARTLVTLLHLRDIATRTGFGFSIVSEMLDVRNRALAEVTRADDFIVSDRLVSLYLSQVSETKALGAVFRDLFDADGSEIYIRPAGDYVTPEVPVSFYTVVEAARRRAEVAVGYRRKALANDAERAYGVVVNPDKSTPVAFAADDHIIVVAVD